MLVSLGTIRLFYSNFGPDDIETRRKLIDKFMSGLRESKILSNEFELFNTHALAHLYEDRLRHKPLFEVSAYSYKNQLRFFKQQFFSQNKRPATLKKRFKCQRILVHKKIDISDLIDFSKEIKNLTEIHELNSHIRTALQLSGNKQINFYLSVKLNYLNITTKSSNNRSKYDCMVKNNDQFFLFQK